MVLPKTLGGCMWYLQKHSSYVVLALLLNTRVFSQTIVKEFNKDSLLKVVRPDSLLQNKIIPNELTVAVQTALLFYPELNKTKIKFQIRKQNSPLSARPCVWAIFQKSAKRKYCVFISSKTKVKLSPILFNNLSFNSQIGVMGHELAHISEYYSKNGIYFMGLFFRHLSKNSIDKFEYNTDKRCIEHGLGYQLLCWSKEVRQKLYINQWGGANNQAGKRERYMNPETIYSLLKSMALYQL